MWDSIIQFASDSWIELVTTGGVTLASVKWLVLDRITLAKKNLEIGNFQGIVNQVGSDVKAVNKVLYDKFEIFQNQLKEHEAKMEKVTQENALLSDLVIQALSVANVPLSAKQQFFNTLTQAVKVNDNVKQTVDAILKAQQQTILQSQEIQDTTEEKLSEV